MNHLEKYDILSNLQHGYRNGCSTETQLLRVINLFAKGLENQSQTDAISLDFSRAFDVVPWTQILHRPGSKKIEDQMYKLADLATPPSKTTPLWKSTPLG